MVEEEKEQGVDSMYQQDSANLMLDVEFNFSVSNPEDNGSSIVYQTKGVDKQGAWEGKRRYSDFFNLYEALLKRWAGCPIPFMPEKKVIGAKDIQFLQDRTFYLQRFLRKCARFEFIIESQEFQLFSRPQGLSIEKSLKGLLPLSSAAKFDRIKAVTKIDPGNYDSSAVAGYRQRITEFNLFFNKIMTMLASKRLVLSNIMQSKQSCNQTYQLLGKFLSDYEDCNLTNYLDYNTNGLIFNHANNTKQKERLEQVTGSLTNPYIEMYHYAKGEVFDLQAMHSAVEAWSAQLKYTADVEKQKWSLEKDVKNVSDGTKTLTTFYKSTSDTADMANKIENMTRDIASSKALCDLMTIYLGERIIPTFKKEKIDLYRKVFAQYQVNEITNCHKTAGFWATILENETVRAAK